MELLRRPKISFSDHRVVGLNLVCGSVISHILVQITEADHFISI